MPSIFSSKALAAIFALSATLTAAQSGTGTTTRYWDCCKPSCAWPGKDGITSPVKSCNINDQPLSDSNVQSGCAGGSAYMCGDQSPWAVNDNLAYGFAAVSTSNPSCCSCYQLTFTSGPVKGKKMIVQATNTGSDVGSTQFDLAIPGGGFGMFDGCSKEWGATTAVWGARYGGPSTNTCSSFPKALQPGCGFRWGWMQGADNPTVEFEVVTCPAALVAKSGCSRPGYQAPTSPQPATTQKITTSTRQPTSTRRVSTTTRRTSSTRRTTTPTRAPTRVVRVVTTSSSKTSTSVQGVPTKPVSRGSRPYRFQPKVQQKEVVQPVAVVEADDTCEN